MTEGLQLIPVGKFADRVLEHLASMDGLQVMEFWKDQNTIALKQFWAYAPSEALELKKGMEAIFEKTKRLKIA